MCKEIKMRKIVNIDLLMCLLSVLKVLPGSWCVHMRLISTSGHTAAVLITVRFWFLEQPINLVMNYFFSAVKLNQNFPLNRKDSSAYIV